jgi:predicted RecB family nuclease
MQQHAHLYGRRTPREGEQPRSQDAVPRLAGELQNIIDRLFDLLPVVRAYVQHPGFEGRFGLKHVAPALVPGLRYDTMEIAEGGTARRTMEAMLLGPAQNPEAKRATRKALLEYCKQDTRATMGVLAWLRAAAL